MLVPCEGDVAYTHTQTLSDIFLKEYHALSKEYRIKGFCIEIVRNNKVPFWCLRLIPCTRNSCVFKVVSTNALPFCPVLCKCLQISINSAHVWNLCKISTNFAHVWPEACTIAKKMSGAVTATWHLWPNPTGISGIGVSPSSAMLQSCFKVRRGKQGIGCLPKKSSAEELLEELPWRTAGTEETGANRIQKTQQSKW